MHLVTVNTGSSSIRLALFALEAAGPRQLAQYRADTDGEAAVAQLRRVLASWPTVEVGAVVHRIVHGGRQLQQPCRLDAAVLQEITRLETNMELIWDTISFFRQ